MLNQGRRANLRSAIKRWLDDGNAGAMHPLLARAYRKYRMTVSDRRFAGRPAQDVFTEIYDKGLWGHDPAFGAFYSGVGSHDEAIVKPYIDATRRFLEELGYPDVVDIGCGDFAVGARLRPYCRGYIAADIVETIIARNTERYADMDVHFAVLDLARDALPQGDVLFVRQLLQHMTNSDIIDAIPEISKKYSYAVITEHIPNYSDFPHNLDKVVGPDIRLYGNPASGVVITSPPFELPVCSERVLCEVPTFDGICHSMIRTTAYRLSSSTRPR